MDGYYDNGNEVCDKCHPSCKTCSLGNSISNCLSCDLLNENREFFKS
jgi:hypothetical protein